MRNARWLYLTAALGTIAISDVAVAQQEPNDSSATADVKEAESTGLSDIVVTAQKRTQNMQDVPLAVTAMTGEALTSSGVVSSEQLKVAVPGLSIKTIGGSFLPSIRGVGSSAYNVENPVALYVDDVYYASQREGLRDLADIEQFTVLKGPQGTLFGRNATGGVIQITTKKPSHDFGGNVSLGYDKYQTLRSNLYVTGGLSDTVAASLSVGYTDQGKGWGRNRFTGSEINKLNHMFSIRGKMLFEPSSATTIEVIGDYMDRNDSLGPNFRPYPGTTLLAPGFGPTKSIYDTYNFVDNRNTFKSLIRN